MIQNIVNCPLFQGVSTVAITGLFETIHHQIKHYEPDEIIIYGNTPCNDLPIVVNGCVTAEMVNFDGRTIKIEEILAPNTLAEAFVFGNQNVYPVNVVAKTECRVMFIQRDELLKLFQLNTQILQNYLDAISNRTQFLTSKMRFLTFKTIKGKLASYILKLSVNNTSNIVLPMTQENLAGFFGVARPSLARALAELQDEGAIKINRREITISNRSILVGYVSTDNC